MRLFTDASTPRTIEVMSGVAISALCCAKTDPESRMRTEKKISVYLASRSRHRSIMVPFFHADRCICLHGRTLLTENSSLSVALKHNEHPEGIPGARGLSQHTQYKFNARQPQPGRREPRRGMHAPAAAAEPNRSRPSGK